jgi:hypothetical protein
MSLSYLAEAVESAIACPMVAFTLWPLLPGPLVFGADCSIPILYHHANSQTEDRNTQIRAVHPSATKGVIEAWV